MRPTKAKGLARASPEDTPNYRSVTGLQPSRKARKPEHKPYESPLERDFYCRLEHDHRVLDYEPQRSESTTRGLMAGPRSTTPTSWSVPPIH